jgi:NodT family efflux transporter outer membrane factor (OMF) lipoprotein
MTMLRATTALAALFALSACDLAPHYHPPVTATASAFKEAPGWQPAQPADAIAKGQWWLLFNDPVLTGLETRVVIDNQNVASYAAQYEQARAAVREARAAFFPTVDLNAGATRAGSFGHTTTIVTGGTGTIGGTGTTTGTGTGVGTGTGSGTGAGTGTGGGTTSTSTVTQVSNGTGSRRYSITVGASWEPDLWGRVRNSVRQQSALAQASQADLANATLSAQGELALDYFQLRGLEQQKRILDATVAAYSRALQITTNRYNQGVVARIDVLQAQTQLQNAQATDADLSRQRATFEHAIAVLVGQNPSTFTLAEAPWAPVVPDVPGTLPSELLERRPDVAAAERRVAAANANIGVQRAAFFPTIGLTGQLGSEASSLGSLFSASSSIWSLGANLAETLLDFGARSARVAEARAAYDQAVADYRQTVLSAIQQVEDELVAARIYAYVAGQRASAADAATRVEQLTQNQYLGGIISYTDVITTQTTALSAREEAALAIVDRQAAAVSLVQAIGGSWDGPAPVPAQLPPGK